MAKCVKGNNFCSNKITFDKQRLGDEDAGPIINISKTSTDFGNVYRNRTTTDNYNVSGTNLTDDITITSDNALVTISKDGGLNFFSSILLTQIGGIVNSTNIILKYSPLVVNSDSGIISHTSSITKNLNWIGEALQGFFTINEISHNFGNVIVGNNAISQFTFSAVGISDPLGANLNSTNPLLEISQDNGATWFTNFNVAADGNGAITNKIIKIKYTPTASSSDAGFVNVISFEITPDPEGFGWVGEGIVQSTIYLENFDAAAVSTVPGDPTYKFPAGWTDPGGDPADPSGKVEWQVYDDGGSAYPYSTGSGLRSLAFSNGNTITETVTAKPFSTIGFTGITIDLLQYRLLGAPPMTIDWSDDNATWNNAGFVDVAANSAWHQAATVNLPVGAENKANIYLRLSATSDATGNFFVIDDLIIKGYS